MELKTILIDKIRPNPFQPREAFSKESIKELADSIKSVGLLQPIVVRQHDSNYQIICGDRRWRAFQFAGLKEIPAIVKDISERRILLESLIENIRREDLTSVERESAIYELWKSGNYKTYRDLDRALGYTEDVVNIIIKGYEFRRSVLSKTDFQSVSTYTLRVTAGLDDETRKTIIEKVSKGEIGAGGELIETVRAIKKAPEPVKQAMLKPKSKITPEKAEIISELEDEFEQEAVIKEIETLGYDEDETKMVVERVKLRGAPRPLPPTLEVVDRSILKLENTLNTAILQWREYRLEGLDIEKKERLHSILEDALDDLISIYHDICKSVKKEPKYVHLVKLGGEK